MIERQRDEQRKIVRRAGVLWASCPTRPGKRIRGVYIETPRFRLFEKQNREKPIRERQELHEYIPNNVTVHFLRLLH